MNVLFWISCIIINRTPFKKLIVHNVAPSKQWNNSLEHNCIFRSNDDMKKSSSESKIVYKIIEILDCKRGGMGQICLCSLTYSLVRCFMSQTSYTLTSQGVCHLSLTYIISSICLLLPFLAYLTQVDLWRPWNILPRHLF